MYNHGLEHYKYPQTLTRQSTWIFIFPSCTSTERSLMAKDSSRCLIRFNAETYICRHVLKTSVRHSRHMYSRCSWVCKQHLRGCYRHVSICAWWYEHSKHMEGHNCRFIDISMVNGSDEILAATCTDMDFPRLEAADFSASAVDLFHPLVRKSFFIR